MNLSSIFGKKEKVLREPFELLRVICIGGLSRLGKELIKANIHTNYNASHLFFAHLAFTTYRYVNINNKINNIDIDGYQEFVITTISDFCKVAAKEFNQNVIQGATMMFQLKCPEYTTVLAQDLIDYDGDAFPAYASFVANELFGSNQDVRKIQDIRTAIEVIDEYFRTIYHSVDIVILRKNY